MHHTSEPKLHKSWTQQQNAGQCWWRGEEEAQKQLKFIIFFILPSSYRGRSQQKLVAGIVASSSGVLELNTN